MVRLVAVAVSAVSEPKTTTPKCERAPALVITSFDPGVPVPYRRGRGCLLLCSQKGELWMSYLP